MRRKFYYWLYCKVFKVKEGSIPPKSLLIIRAILYPLEAYIATNEHINYNFATDTFTIYGIKYSGRLFYDWSEKGLPIGTTFQIAKRENGTLYLNKNENGGNNGGN